MATPSSSSSLSLQCLPLASAERCFAHCIKHLGRERIGELRATFAADWAKLQQRGQGGGAGGRVPVAAVTISGDQCTGKSTLTRGLVEGWDRRHTWSLVSQNDAAGASSSPPPPSWPESTRLVSIGSLFRAEAERRGASLAALSELARRDPSIDTSIDLECLRLMRGACLSATSAGAYASPVPRPPVLVVEGRQTGVMAALCRASVLEASGDAAVLAPPRILSVFLQCHPVEQAARFLEREVAPSVGERLRRHYTTGDGGDGGTGRHGVERLADVTLADVARDLPHLDLFSASDDGGSAGGAAESIHKFVENVDRDERDRRRFHELYHGGDGAGALGAAERDLKRRVLDYRTRDLYDLVVDTTPNTPGDTFREVTTALNALNALNVHTHPTDATRRGD